MTRSDILIFLAILPIQLFSCPQQHLQEIRVTSPDQAFQFYLETRNGLSYSVTWKQDLIIDDSELGFLLENGSIVPGDVTLGKVDSTTKDEKWSPVYGEQKEYSDHYNEVLVQLVADHLAGNYALRIRCYSEGVAFRYEVKHAPQLNIAQELTAFTFANEPTIWASECAQCPVEQGKLSDWDRVASRPLVAQTSDSIFIAIGEAALVDFARMKFSLDSDKENTLVATLSKNEEQPVTVEPGEFNSPWRFVMAGDTPADLLQNNFLLLNLNETNQISDPTFIKPGKVLREVTLTTKGGMVAVDFAQKHNIEFIEFDAGWYGREYDDDSDATTVTVDSKRSPGPLDLQKVIDYGKEKSVGVILYVNRRALEKQIDEILPLYRSWGVAGLKFGFVQTGSQEWTIWLHESIRKAAKHELMVDVHDQYRPTGYSRTYPNLMTQEGIRGDEESPTNELVIRTLFTRMIAGAGDHTNCYFADRVSQKMGSHASQMAKAICIYSPWQFIYWYDRPEGAPIQKGGAGGSVSVIKEVKDLQFYDQLPTVWDATKVIEGYPGKYAAIARKKGKNWYLGALAGNEPYAVDLKLDFLEAGVAYKATIFADDASLRTSTNVRITEVEVNRDTVLREEILRQNGMAVIFMPVDQ